MAGIRLKERVSLEIMQGLLNVLFGQFAQTPRGRKRSIGRKFRHPERAALEGVDEQRPQGGSVVGPVEMWPPDVERANVLELGCASAGNIMGEFLTRDNAPCHVGDFIKRAADEELDYLCEADLSAAVPPTLDPAIRDRIASIAAAPGRGVAGWLRAANAAGPGLAPTVGGLPIVAAPGSNCETGARSGSRYLVPQRLGRWRVKPEQRCECGHMLRLRQRDRHGRVGQLAVVGG